MRTTNRERYESLERILARCEEYRDRLGTMPSGTALVQQLRESVKTAEDYFRTRPDRRRTPRQTRQACRKAAADRLHSAMTVRRLTQDLLREARFLCAETGVAIELPPLWNGSRQRLVADARSALNTVAPLAAVFRTRGIASYDELPQWIARLDDAIGVYIASR